MKRAILMLVAVMVVLAMIVPASATPLPPGGAVTASPGALPSGTIVASTGLQTYNFGPNSGTYQEDVYFTGGTYQFAFMISVSTGDISQLSSGPWADLFAIDATQTSSGWQATGVTRGFDGPIDIQFQPSVNNLKAGNSPSSWVILSTNAKEFTVGTLGLQDTGASGNLNGFVATTPEPATLSLLGFGFLGLGALRKKLRK